MILSFSCDWSTASAKYRCTIPNHLLRNNGTKLSWSIALAARSLASIRSLARPPSAIRAGLHPFGPSSAAFAAFSAFAVIAASAATCLVQAPSRFFFVFHHRDAESLRKRTLAVECKSRTLSLSKGTAFEAETELELSAEHKGPS